MITMSRFNKRYIANFIRISSLNYSLFKANNKFEVNYPIQKENKEKPIKIKDLSELALLYNNDDSSSTYTYDLIDFIENYPSNKKFFIFKDAYAYSCAEFTSEFEKNGNMCCRSVIFHPIKEFKIGDVEGDYCCYSLEDQFMDYQLRNIINASKPKQESSGVPEKWKKYSDDERAKLVEQAKQRKFEDDCKKIEAEIRKYGRVVHKDLKDSKYAEFTKQCLEKFHEEQRIEFAYDKDSFVPKIRRTQYKLADSLANENIIGTIELIERVPGANRHNKHKFDANGVVRKFAYKTKTGFNIIELCVFYCETCGKYFDFIESYKAQLRNANIDIETIAAKHVKPSGEVIHFGQIFDWSKESVLKKFGYSVGYNGLNINVRQRILSFLISSEIMTLKEVKQYLEMFININGKKSGNAAAKADWEDDLKFINEYRIKSKRK